MKKLTIREEIRALILPKIKKAISELEVGDCLNLVHGDSSDLCFADNVKIIKITKETIIWNYSDWARGEMNKKILENDLLHFRADIIKK